MENTVFGHLRVLDLSSYIAGPFCAKMVADYGADVIKVEPPGTGDVARSAGPFAGDDPHPEKSLLFFYLNCNKRGVTLNLESSAGKALFLKLVKEADALIESYPPGYLDGLGLGYKALEEINPRIVVTSITPFGQTGPYRDYLGNDLVHYAFGGIMYTSGAYAREPLKHGHPQSFYMGAIHAAYATSAALFAREFTGRGQQVDVSLAEATAAHHYGPAVRYSYTGTVERRAAKNEAGSTKGIRFEGIIPSKDGYFGPSFQRGRGQRPPLTEFAELIESPELAKLSTEPAGQRGQLSDEVDTKLLEVMGQWNKFDYFNKAMADGWVASIVQTSEDLANCPQLEERDFYREIEHPILGKVKVPGELFRLPEAPWSLRLPAPLLGQHNEAVYCGELGYERAQLVKLRQLGAI